jgi:DNA-binding response OmpR family regulator/HPt (histidine-containing phosphotransfer) domain-containing protein
MKILLVEDDDVLTKVLTRSLTTHHYVVDTVRDGEMGWTYGSTFEYDLIVLDIMLPKLDGISLCKRFRAEGYTTPILLLTAQDTRTIKVQGLDAGADDYVVKPFDRVELIARIRALLRRSSTNPFPLLTWGDLLLNPSTCEVSYNGHPLSLTAKEYELLELLLRDSQYVFGTDELIDRLWSSEEFPSEATVRSHIRRVRQKLVCAGAPPDFIATLHGRGYYLKAPSTKAATGDSFSSNQSNSADSGRMLFPLATPDGILPPSSSKNLPPDSRQQYLSFLNETWTTTKPKSLEQMAALLQTVRNLQSDRLTPQQQAEAQQIAHKLAGTLGIFGLTKTTHLARQLEYWLGGREPLQPKHAPLMKTLVTALQQEIQNTTQIELSQIPDEQLPLLLLVSSDNTFNQSLMTAATSCGIRIEIAPPPESAFEWADLQPNVVLLRLPADPAQAGADDRPHASHLLETLQVVACRHPTLPILVMGDRGELSDRLEVLRRGGKLFLEAQTPLEQVMAAVVHLLGGRDLPPKVMIVDDDRAWLSTLPTLLKPWGFKVTTLAEPQQFWTVLQSVTPDVLLLDVNMPQIDGFELCQILRSDPHWQQLPVLFLSVLTDATSQDRAFTVGADDYLCKPVMGVALANRILSRLHRARAYAG